MSKELIKGDYMGKCNRTACQQSPATYYNHSTRLYYCKECAEIINEMNHIDAIRMYSHELCTEGLYIEPIAKPVFAAEAEYSNNPKDFTIPYEQDECREGMKELEKEYVYEVLESKGWKKTHKAMYDRFPEDKRRILKMCYKTNDPRMLVKLPFNIDDARHGETAVYEDGSSVMQIIHADKAKKPVISVDQDGNIWQHNIAGAGEKNIFMAASGLSAVIENEMVKYADVTFPIANLYTMNYQQHGEIPDDYLSRITNTVIPHPLCGAHIDLMKKHGFLIDPISKRIFFKMKQNTGSDQ